jgi:hypothetical protein
MTRLSIWRSDYQVGQFDLSASLQSVKAHRTVNYNFTHFNSTFTVCYAFLLPSKRGAFAGLRTNLLWLNCRRKVLRHQCRGQLQQRFKVSEMHFSIRRPPFRQEARPPFSIENPKQTHFFSYLLPTNERSSKQKTPVCRKTICPRWEHTLRWDDLTLADLANSCLELTVWDHDRLPGRHSECLGGARFNLGTGIQHFYSRNSILCGLS